MRFVYLFPVLCSFLLLTACGFKPLYGTDTAQNQNGHARLSDIEISNIPDREGVLLRNHLIDRFYQNGYPTLPRYRLDVSAIRSQTRDLDVTIRSDATREQIRLSTTITLYDMQLDKKILSRELSAVGSYNVLESQYTTYVSRGDVRDNLVRDLALQTERQVMLALERN
jgi:LPS-assembly lipoprotein